MAKEDDESQQKKTKTHKAWRKEAKKLRRQRIRRKLAEEQNKLAAEEETARLNDPNYTKWLKEQEELELLEAEQEERQRQQQEELWLRRELLARKLFREQEQREKATAAIKEAERLRIQKEFEELQEKTKKRIEERKKREEQAKREHEEMMEKIFDYMELGGEIPEELKSSVQSNPNKPICPFFAKTNACRYGIQCSRNHIRPKLSRILFIPNFFSHIKLDHGGTSHGNDINLECSDKDLNDDYRNFFEDVTEELKKFGQILIFCTCLNTQSHLRGNVLVEYSSERDALKAFVQLQGRYYARRRINVEFSSISSWNGAICGLSSTNRCPKGRGCNFLHIFKNPCNLLNYSFHKQNKNNNQIENNSQKDVKEIASWNDEKGDRSRRDWRWSESPEPSSKRSKHHGDSKERSNQKDRIKSSEISSKNDSRKRTNSRDRSSSCNLRHDSVRSKDRKERKRSKSRSPLHSRKHHEEDDREKRHKNKKRKHKSKKSS